MVGTLYPTAPEKAHYFTAIEGYVGQPHGKNGLPGRWNDWKDAKGVKHKGSGVDALEKARMHPELWGLEHNHAIVGEAPPRPQRVVPPLKGGEGSRALVLSSASNLSPADELLLQMTHQQKVLQEQELRLQQQRRELFEQQWADMKKEGKEVRRPRRGGGGGGCSTYRARGEVMLTPTHSCTLATRLRLR